MSRYTHLPNAHSVPAPRTNTMCQWELLIWWSNGARSRHVESSGLGHALEKAGDELLARTFEEARRTTGDKYPVEVTVRLFDIHTEATE